MITLLRRTWLVVSFLILAFAVDAQAQTTYTVTVASKSAEHPWSGQGWPEGYVIDGVEGAALTLVRGETYVFQLQNVASVHPFYIATSESGGGAGEYDDGVEGNFATGNETLTFTVPEDAPDVLYYQCSFHPRMGGVLNIVSGGTAAERPEVPASIRLDQNYPNPFNPETGITFALESSESVTLSIVDATGRTVRVLVDATLPAGEHAVSWDGMTADGRAAASGTYLYRLETNDESISRAMTLLR